MLGADAEPIAKEINLAADEIVINDDWEKGQLSSIQSALRSLPPQTDGIMLLLIDHPLISSSLVDELIETFYTSGKSIVLPVYEGRRGHPVIFSATLYPGIDECAARDGRTLRRLGASRRSSSRSDERRRLRP